MLAILRRWRQRRITVSAFSSGAYSDYLNSLGVKQKTLSNRKRATVFIVEHLGHYSMADVRPSDIARMVSHIHANGKRVQSQRVLQETKSLFYQAVLEGVIDKNPADPIKALHAPPERSRLTLEEWQSIEQWSKRKGWVWFSVALRLALITGQRRSDLVRMRFDHVVDGRLTIEQYKTGARIALPLELRLQAIDVSLAEVIADCKSYRRAGSYMLRKENGQPYGPSSLSDRFLEARKGAFPNKDWSPKTPPSLHEIRSLSERLYREQGVDTMTLLGHKRQYMTDSYNDARGLDSGKWRELNL